MAKINVKEIRSGVRLNTSKPLDMATISIANFVPVSNTEAFLLISQDTSNDLKLGSDNKLMVATDELNTSFNYATSVDTFWSI